MDGPLSSVNKIKLMVTILYEVMKDNIMKVDVGGRLMGCFVLTKIVDLDTSDSLSQMAFYSLDNLYHCYLGILDKLYHG